MCSGKTLLSSMVYTKMQINAVWMAHFSSYTITCLFYFFFLYCFWYLRPCVKIILNDFSFLADWSELWLFGLCYNYCHFISADCYISLFFQGCVSYANVFKKANHLQVVVICKVCSIYLIKMLMGWKTWLLYIFIYKYMFIMNI